MQTVGDFDFRLIFTKTEMEQSGLTNKIPAFYFKNRAKPKSMPSLVVNGQI
jgi:hypothetical protein